MFTIVRTAQLDRLERELDALRAEVVVLKHRTEIHHEFDLRRGVYGQPDPAAIDSVVACLLHHLKLKIVPGYRVGVHLKPIEDDKCTS